MKILNSFIGASPDMLKQKIFILSDYVKTDIFNLPNPYVDIKNIAKLTRPKIFLDVGAYVGDTVKKYRSILDNLPIHAFEPSYSSYLKLVENTKGLKNVFTYNLGISNKEGTRKLFINNNPQTNSYLDNDVGNKESLGGQTKHVGEETIKITSLDKWFETNLNNNGGIIIKADVQGAEVDLIRGADSCLKNNVIALYTEVSLAPLYKSQADLFIVNNILTNEYDFILFQIYRTRSDEHGRALWTDALWLHRDALKSM